MPRSKKVVFFGNEQIATGVSTSAPTLSRLIAHGYEIVAVIEKPSSSNKSRTKREVVAETIAKQHRIPVLYPEKLLEFKEALEGLQADIGVLVAYGKIIPEAIISSFPQGIVNIHPSLLPQGRGSTPIESTILDGASTTGVSLMRLVKKMDTGPIFDQRSLPLTGKETKQELNDHLLDIGSKLLIESLNSILDNQIYATPQDDTKASYTKLIQKADGIIDWQKPAHILEREIRAYSGWPKSTTKLTSLDVIITQAAVIKGISGNPGQLIEKDNRLIVASSEDGLEITRLVLPGKGEMDSRAFLAGYMSQL